MFSAETERHAIADLIEKVEEWTDVEVMDEIVTHVKLHWTIALAGPTIRTIVSEWKKNDFSLFMSFDCKSLEQCKTIWYNLECKIKVLHIALCHQMSLKYMLFLIVLLSIITAYSFFQNMFEETKSFVKWKLN